MRLESDPTLVFAHGDFSITWVKDKHKEIDSPYYHCSSAKLTFEEPQVLQLDGEVIGKFSEVNMELLPSTIKLLTSKKNPFVT